MACTSCTQQRLELRRAIAAGRVVAAVKIAASGTAKILRDLSPMPRRTTPKQFTKS